MCIDQSTFLKTPMVIFETYMCFDQRKSDMGCIRAQILKLVKERLVVESLVVESLVVKVESLLVKVYVARWIFVGRVK